MQLALWITVCLVAAYALRRRPVVLVVATLALWLAVPAAAGELVTGRAAGPLGFHPAVWLVSASVGVQALENPRHVFRAVARHIYLALALSLVIAVAVVTTHFGESGGMALVAGQVIGPVLLFLLVLTAGSIDPRTVERLRTALIVMAALSAGLALVQWVRGDVIFYGSHFATRWWFAQDGYDRWMATTDHPLVLSFLLCVVAPLLIGIRRASLQLALLVLFTTAVVITQSRTGVVVMALVGALVVGRSRTSAGTKLVVYFALSAAVLGVLASDVARGLAERFQDDTGSTGARVSAVGFFAETWQDYALLGQGFTSSYRVASGGGLETSLESSVLMYAVDIGLVFALLYFGAQALIVLGGTVTAPPRGLVASGALVLLLPQTFSALAAGNAVGPIVWTVLGMILASRDASRPADPVPRPATTVAATQQERSPSR